MNKTELENLIESIVKRVLTEDVLKWTNAQIQKWKILRDKFDAESRISTKLDKYTNANEKAADKLNAYEKELGLNNAKIISQFYKAANYIEKNY